MYFNPKQESETTLRSSAETDNNSAIIDAATAFAFTEYDNCRDNVPKQRVLSWEAFLKDFCRHVPRAQKDGAAWSPATYANGDLRANKNVVNVQLAVLDIDNGVAPEVLLPQLAGYAYLAHSSYGYSPTTVKYRVILPLAAPVLAADWTQAWARINALVGGCNDPATKDPSRLYYKGAHPPGTNWHFVRTQVGRPIDIQQLPEAVVASGTPVARVVGWGAGKAAPEIDGIEPSGPDLNFAQGLSEVVGRCRFMQYAAAPENQPSLAEPLWMAMLSNACRFENSEAWIHAASEYHDGYIEGETSARIDRYRNGPPPVTCQRIRDLGFTECPAGGCRRPNGQVTKAPAGLMGWMFRRQLTATQNDSASLPEEYQVASFEVRPEGVFQPIYKDGEVDRRIRLSSRLDVVALTRDHESSNWGLEVRFTDPDGVQKSWAMPREYLAGSPDAYRAAFMRMGATIEPGNTAKAGLSAYLVAAMPASRALSIRQPGWFNERFVLPNAICGTGEQRVVYQTTDPDEIKRFDPKGSLESWQREVARPCRGNSRAVLSVCTGLAAPLLALLSEDNGGFNLRGNSSVGKSICLALGASVWGAPQLIRTWNVTVNGLEGIATAHNDLLLPLDELGQADGKAAGEAAYMLGNGQGKGRAGRDGDAKVAKRWRTLVLSSGERSIADLMQSSGLSSMAGQEVRLVDIPADAEKGLGIFDTIHGAPSSQSFAEQLKRSAAENYGFAGRALVDVLADPTVQPMLISRVKAMIPQFTDRFVPADASGQVGRVGRRFGLVAAAGELAIELGILPWPEGEAIDACRICFCAWIDQRGGVGNHEAEQAIAQIRRYIELYGESRFTAWMEGIDNNGLGKTVQRAGFRQVTADGRTEYFVLPEVYRTELCNGLNATYVTKILVERKYLATTKEGKAQVEKRLPGLGRQRVYHLKPDLMCAGVSQHDNEETQGRQQVPPKRPIKYSV